MTSNIPHPVRLAVLGAGLIGKEHIERVLAEDCAQLAAIADPAPDLLRHLCGEVVAVQVMESNALRNNVVADTTVILVKFACGAPGMVSVSDTIVAPWSWEFTSGENAGYTHTAESCYLLCGGTGQHPGHPSHRHSVARLG